MKQVKTTEFQSEVLNASEQVLVDFWAPWCGPCRAQGPILEDLAAETAGTLKIVKVNVDEEQRLAIRFGISSIPTLLVFRNGEQVNKAVGYMPKEQLEALLK